MPKIKHPQLVGLNKIHRKIYFREWRRLTNKNFQEWRVKEEHNSLPLNARSIPDYPTYYATPNGEIWRDTINELKRVKNGKERIVKIKDRYNPSCGYHQVQLYQNGKRKLCYVHRLVLLAFEGYPEQPGMECHHIDSNTSNNCIDNLEWVTRLENIRYVPHEKRAVSKKKYGTGRKFSDSKWSSFRKQITDLVDAGLKNKAISEQLGVPVSTLSFHKKMYKKYS